MRSIQRFTPLFLRLALGVGFLSAVSDRFGLWGPPGAPNVAWGDFGRFTEYAAQLNPWAPGAIVPVLAWIATTGEIVFGVALIVGIFVRQVSLGSGVLLLLFALGMTVGTGLESALNASVYSAAAAAFALALLGPGGWSVDALREAGSDLES